MQYSNLMIYLLICIRIIILIQVSSDIPIRLKTGLDLHELTSDKGAELYFDDSQEFKGTYVHIILTLIFYVRMCIQNVCNMYACTFVYTI